MQIYFCLFLFYKWSYAERIWAKYYNISPEGLWDLALSPDEI
jgi:hypothetical protein